MGEPGLIAGVDIGGTKVLAGLVDATGRVVSSLERASDPHAGSSSVSLALEELLARAPGPVEAIGVGAAAWVEHPSGVIAFAPNLTYEDPNLGAKIAREFRVPVVVENDANAAAWAEAVWGAGHGVANFILLTLGTGIGGAAIIDGSLYRGSRGFAGEFGHMTILEDGPQCACGRRGCLEALASGSAIERMAREALESEGHAEAASVSGEWIAAAAKRSDPIALQVLATAGKYLGAGLANLTHLFDPEIIVLGGGAANAGEPLTAPALERLQNEFRGKREVPKVVDARFGNDAGMIGAAELARASIGKWN